MMNPINSLVFESSVECFCCAFFLMQGIYTLHIISEIPILVGNVRTIS